MKTQKILNSQNSPEKEQSWMNYAPWLQTILQNYSNQNSMVLAQKQIHRWMENAEISPWTNGQLIYYKGCKNMQWRKERLFNKWSWENQKATCKKMKLVCYLIPYTKVNSKWIKVLNVRPDIIKLLEENICMKFFDINCSNAFFGFMTKCNRKNKYIHKKITSYYYYYIYYYFVTYICITKNTKEERKWI